MIEVYTDGACSPNPGIGGWAACFRLNSEIHEVYGYAENTTNNKMELTAVIEGIRLVRDIALEEKDITVYSDSQWVIKCATNEWQRKANLDLWDTLILVTSGFNINWVWVAGHCGNELNERCDSLAVKARTQKITNKERQQINRINTNDFKVVYGWDKSKEEQAEVEKIIEEANSYDPIYKRLDEATNDFIDNLQVITYKENFDRIVLFLTALGYQAKGALLENNFDKCKDVLQKLLDYIDKNIIGDF